MEVRNLAVPKLTSPVRCQARESSFSRLLGFPMHATGFLFFLATFVSATASIHAQSPIRFHTSAPRQSPIATVASVLPTQEQVLEPSLVRTPPTGNIVAMPMPGDDAITPERLASLMRPMFGLSAEWQVRTNEVELTSYDARIQLPTFPFFGPPPPFINGGFSYTHINAPAAFDLPTNVYDCSLGSSWMRPINDRWMLRFMFSVALATDGENTSSDAWQFRGGVFAICTF